MQKNDSKKYLTCAEFCEIEALPVLMENIYMYVQFEGMGYQQMAWIPIYIKCAPFMLFMFILLWESPYVLPFTNHNGMTLIDIQPDQSKL